MTVTVKAEVPQPEQRACFKTKQSFPKPFLRRERTIALAVFYTVVTVTTKVRYACRRDAPVGRIRA